jgi:hypothetical protein
MTTKDRMTTKDKDGMTAKGKQFVEESGMRNEWIGKSVVAVVLAAMLFGAVGAARAGESFVKPTKEELEMKELPGYPGAAAVVLYREEVTRDDLHVVQHYERIKILTEDGLKYANVELGYFSTHDFGLDVGDNKSLGDIAGRTIHADGTIIPFTGKPYLKTIAKGQTKDIGYSMQEKVFTLPDVQVGSIIEYRYATRYNDQVYEAPDWYIQGDLYVKAAHYTWYPTSQDMIDGDTQSEVNAISWFSILPPGAKIDARELPGTQPDGRVARVYDLTVKDVPPTLHEDFMPPTKSFSYRVLYNFTAYQSGAEYWKGKGKHWSKRVNNFTDPNQNLINATQAVIAGATTQDEKLRKIYAAVMALENTHFTRSREEREDKAGGHKVNTAADVLDNKRGDESQLTQLFVGMARAAGMKAYLMLVPDRSEELFTPSWLTFQQFDDLIAIVNVNGKEVYFDPGQRYCDYGHLAWQHTFVQGLRQVENGTDFALTSGDGYVANHTSRVANLVMDEHGVVTGKIDLTFDGSPALRWRHVALEGDEESLKHQLRTNLEEMLPKGLEVKVLNIDNIATYDKPLKVTYSVEGAPGTPTGKRLVLPADLFTSGEHATFPHEKREVAVYFPYAQAVQDALRITLPAQMAVEGVPDAAKAGLPKTAAYTLTVTSAPNSFTTRRTYAFGNIIIPATDYAALRTFYGQFETSDQQSVVLKQNPVQASAAAAPGN